MSNLRPAVESAGLSTPAEPERLSPLLWPLAAYLAVGTLLLFLVSQVDAVAASIMPWDAKAHRWHEGSAGWMALFPATTPVLLGYAVMRVGAAVPLRVVHAIGTLLHGVACAVARTWDSVRVAIGRAGRAVQAMLHDAMRAVRKTADITVRRVRAALARLTSR